MENNIDPQCRRVLVVEDEPNTRAIVLDTLSLDGYDVIEAEDGEQGLAICSNQLPDLVITDIMMPKVNGYEFIRRFREDYRASAYVPILVLTAINEVDKRVEVLQCGADDYLCKPFSYKELQARTEALLRIKNLSEKLVLRNKQLEQALSDISALQMEIPLGIHERVSAGIFETAATNLCQPVTSISLNCRVMEGAFTSEPIDAVKIVNSISAIKNECAEMRKILSTMTAAYPKR